MQDQATGLIEKSNGICVDISKISPHTNPDTLFSDGFYLQEVIKDLCQQKRETMDLYTLATRLYTLSSEEWNQIFQALYPKIASKTLLCRNSSSSLLELKDLQTQILLDFYILPNPSRPDFVAAEGEDLASLTQNIIRILLKRAEQKGKKRFYEALMVNTKN